MRFIRIYEYEDGSYKGAIKRKKPHGIGIYKYVSYMGGGTYTGRFKNGQMHGKGKFVFNNKDRYKGKFKNGQMHGWGEFKYANGDVYLGYFEKGERSGLGRFIKASGESILANWQGTKQLKVYGNNNSTSTTSYSNKNGYQEEYTYITIKTSNVYDKWVKERVVSTSYKGYYKDGKKHGQGTYKSYHYNGFGMLDTRKSYIQEGEWVNGVFRGVKKSIDKSNYEERMSMSRR